MSPSAEQSWESFNQAALMQALAELRSALERHLAPPGPDAPLTDSAAQQPAGEQNPPASPSQPTAIDSLAAAFGLSSFERKILLLAAAVELDAAFTPLFDAANKGQHPALPTFSLALAAFPDAHWSALLPNRPLRLWRLIELLPADSLTTSRLRIDERILHFLTGIPSLDERLRGIADPFALDRSLTASEASLAQRIAERLSPDHWQSACPAIQLCGPLAESRRAVAAAALATLGLNLHRIAPQALPHAAAELDLLVRLWERESILQPSGLLLEIDENATLDPAADFALNRLMDSLRSPLLVSSREPVKTAARKLLFFELPQPSSAEQIQLWHQALHPVAPHLESEIEAIVSQFSLSAESIRAAVAQLPAQTEPPQPSTSAHPLAPELWQACRTQSRPRLEGLAERINPAAGWDDLILPAQQKQLLALIALHVRQRRKVYTSWGFGLNGTRGLGISALFAGPSGTGKTMAGEVLANQLNLDIYRIDLSQVISKYIGETEKNLRRVFDAAEQSAAILLFDEADALFGKRSEVKDSHDRYANIEVSYLLQRMEAYRGLAILTTNRRDALDPAFLRRIRFIVEFPFPAAAERAQIWQRAFPSLTPTLDLRIDRLARLNAAGGNIRNIAMGAAFLAADAGEPIRMAHLLQAARSEFLKIERPLNEAETAGWL